MKIKDIGELCPIRAKLGRVGGCGAGGKFRGLSIRCPQSRKPAAGSYSKNDDHLLPQCRERVSRNGRTPPLAMKGHSRKRQRSAGNYKRGGADYLLTGAVRLLVKWTLRLGVQVCRALRGTSAPVPSTRSGGGKINSCCCGGCLCSGCKRGGRPRTAADL
jgi:hypothetical protein